MVIWRSCLYRWWFKQPVLKSLYLKSQHPSTGCLRIHGLKPSLDHKTRMRFLTTIAGLQSQTSTLESSCYLILFYSTSSSVQTRAKEKIEMMVSTNLSIPVFHANVDYARELVTAYDITAIPTLLLNGKRDHQEISRVEGVDENAIRELLSQFQ